uniref:Uncharacterized protein n=1 Tax=Glossina palpalis gambiensis TaxID=67801 RepID=A0A1B0AMG8_9MUSC
MLAYKTRHLSENPPKSKSLKNLIKLTVVTLNSEIRDKDLCMSSKECLDCIFNTIDIGVVIRNTASARG